MREGKIFVVEGYDGVGKTTVCKALVEEYDGIYFHCPSGKSSLTQGMYELFKNYNDMDETTKLLMILATHVENIKMMNDLKARGEIVVADRSILSTYAYQHISYDSFNAIMRELDFPVLEVDEVLVLTASVDELKSRLSGRADSDNLDDYFFINLERIMIKYHDHFDDIFPNAHKVSTMNKTPVEVLKRVRNILKRKL